MLIDTDTASDDAIALVMATAPGLAEVLAVTTVAGNVPLAQCTRNALYTLQLAGAARVPVYPGCDQPLLRVHESAQDVHGADGMGDIGLPEPDRGPESEHGADAIPRIAGEHPPGTVTLVTLGPLTNLAAALVRDRGLLRRFRHVYCMAGAADCVGNITATAEFNVWADPESAAMVLAASDPDHVTWVGWDVSRQDAMVTPTDQERLQSLGTPLARFAHDITGTVQERTARVAGPAGPVGHSLPDPVTMAIALDPSLVLESERVWATVALDPEARGQVIIDRRSNAPAANVTLIRRADGPRFRAALFAACAVRPGAR